MFKFDSSRYFRRSYYVIEFSYEDSDILSNRLLVGFKHKLSATLLAFLLNKLPKCEKDSRKYYSVIKVISWKS